jgi:YD repeat-containing protein
MRRPRQSSDPRAISSVMAFPNRMSTIQSDAAMGGWVCYGTPTPACPAQAYGFGANWKGSQLTSSADDITSSGQTTFYGYDEFNRLTSANYTNGPHTFSYTYDRYGNRWQQNAPQGGPAPSYAFNTSNNQISDFAYDAAGNITNDGFHSYEPAPAQTAMHLHYWAAAATCGQCPVSISETLGTGQRPRG